MIASTSAIHAHNLFGQKPSSKFTSSYFHSNSDLHTNRCFEIRASEISKEYSPQNDEDSIASFYNDLYKKVNKLKSLLPKELDEMTKMPLVKNSQEINTHESSFGVILDFKGVVVENDDPLLNPLVWHVLSLEEEKALPAGEKLEQIEGLKTERAISILNWSHDPKEIKRIVNRKETIYKNRHKPYELRDGTLKFIFTLIRSNIPIAVVSDLSKETLKEAVDSVGLEGCFEAMVSLQDVEKEEELYLTAASSIFIGQDRCVVFCSDEVAIENVRWNGMKCVGVASKNPVYELGAADHVVRYLDQVSFKGLEELVCGKKTSEAHMEIVLEE
ncbi:hypothetical protein LUZ60_016781 [Juncus effusus]|nr:hypothetical protein LUZ60_016781 [Juncus effusus]